ncbi:hypothetical protein PTKIN_Ptkin09bG0225500 [Pterospermum kingtungense]
MNKLVENASSMYKYSAAKTGIGNIGEMTEEFPSLMTSSSHDQDTDKGDDEDAYLGFRKHSHVRTSKKQGSWIKEGNDAMVEKFLEKYHITGSVDSKISKHAVVMKFEKKVEICQEIRSKHLLVHYNKKGQTPKEIFTETHKALIKDSSAWFTKSSESCSVVATLIAAVAFATPSNIPGGVNQETGKPVLRDEPAFGVFAISSLVALCLSVTALVFFLAILTSQFEEKDFAMKLPRNLIMGLTFSIYIYSCNAGLLLCRIFLEVHDKLKFATFPIYATTSLPISLFALAQMPVYIDLVCAIFTKIP